MQIHKINEQLSEMLITDNNTVNGILWSKENLASKEGIKLDINVELPKEDTINEDDLGMIISNLLNMAINYLSTQNIIYFVARVEDNNYAVRISNKEILDSEKRNLFIMNQIDKKFFSDILEMKIIQNIVHKYKGEIFYKANSSILIFIPIINISEKNKEN